MMTSAQCRAARALLNVSREQVAEAAGVAVRTLSDFESDRRVPIKATESAIRKVFEDAGVEFVEVDGYGVGVKLNEVGVKIVKRRRALSLIAAIDEMKYMEELETTTDKKKEAC